MTPTELSTWKARIERAKSVQGQMHLTWQNSIDLYNCAYFDKAFGGLDFERVDVHFANWYINNIVPLVYFRDPYIFIKGRSNPYFAFGTTLETVVNIEWRRLELKQQFKRVILSTCLMPPGWLKTGYTAKIGQDIAKLDEHRQKDLIKSLKDAVSGVFREKKALTPEEQGVLDEYIEEESIFASWVSSWNMLIPEGYQLISQMPYLIEIEDLPKIDFMANPFYKNKDKAKPSTDVSTKATGGREVRRPTYNRLPPSTKDDETATVRLYHIWDRRTNKRLTISDEDWHFKGDWSYDVDGFMHEPLIFDESLPEQHKSNPYPPNLLQPIFPQIIEQSQARTQMVKWRKRASAIIMAQKGILTEEDMRQIEKTEGVQIVYVSNIGAFQMTQTPNLPNNVFDVDKIIKQDLQMGTNMGQLMFQAQPGQRTATQAQIGQSGLQLKASARVDVVEDFTVRVARKIALLLWQFHSREKISEMIGEKVTPAMWPDLPDNPQERRRIMNSEIQVRIDAGSAAPPKDETVDRKQLLDFTSMVGAVAPEKIKKGPWVAKLVERFKFAKDVEQVVKTDEEGEIRAAQEENQYMSQGMPQAVSPNEDHEIHIQVHSQMAGDPLVDEHILKHANFMGIPQSGVSAKPQAGDTKSPSKSATPELARKAPPTQGGMYQSVQNVGAGSKGGI